MFKRLSEDEALIVDRGVFRPAEVYEGPDGGLFIKAKGGFLRVKTNGATSHESVKVQTLQREGMLYQDRFGRLCVAPGPERAQVMVTGATEGPIALPAPNPVD
jgi:hypothetical protein